MPYNEGRMEKESCFLCKQSLNKFTIKWPYDGIKAAKIPIPQGMTENDWLCDDCYVVEKDKIKNGKSQKYKTLGKDKREDKTGSAYASQTEKLRSYRKKWNEYNVIQFKNERIAILQKQQTTDMSFVMAFDEMTKQGYRLVAIENEKTKFRGDSSSETIHQSSNSSLKSYYYFQRFPSLNYTDVKDGN